MTLQCLREPVKYSKLFEMCASTYLLVHKAPLLNVLASPWQRMVQLIIDQRSDSILGRNMS